MLAYKGMYWVNGRLLSMMSTEEFKMWMWYILGNDEMLGLCDNGFHYCNDPMEVRNYFTNITDDPKNYLNGTFEKIPVMALIEVMGSRVDSRDIHSRKSCTDCFRIIYCYSLEDYSMMMDGMKEVERANKKIKERYI